MLKSIIFTLLLATTLLTTANGFFWNKDRKVLLKDVDVLILYKDRMTTGRRKPPVPQLNCVGGNEKLEF